ncbi:MAG: hypothetical protein M3N39_08285 [Pseudomonadota bacterium]|nr:hypothetical protein [Pseudomonadota bacterium]
MTISLSENLLVALVSLGLVPWIIWTVRRGLRSGMLPIGRGYVRRDERPQAFNMLLWVYALVALLAVYIAFDLAFGSQP